MISVYVQVTDGDEPYCDDHYDFEIVPRKGDIAVIEHEGEALQIEVVSVKVRAQSKGAIANARSSVSVQATVIGAE